MNVTSLLFEQSVSGKGKKGERGQCVRERRRSIHKKEESFKVQRPGKQRALGGRKDPVKVERKDSFWRLCMGPGGALQRQKTD